MGRGAYIPTGQKQSIIVEIFSLKTPGTQRRRERWILLCYTSGFRIVGNKIVGRPTDMVASLGLAPILLGAKGECHDLL